MILLKRILVLILCTYTIGVMGQTRDVEKTSIILGDQIKLFSSTLNEYRIINIWLPETYSDTSSKKFPVIYLLDGSVNEDFIHIVGLVQFGSFPWVNLVPESIVVGISNNDRKKDFTFPSLSKQDIEEFPTAGGSENFIQFIKNELQPFIDRNYKSNNTRTIIGQSFGGLLASEILIKYPETFDNYIIVSPSLWWDNESLLQLKHYPPLSGKSIYIGVGEEGNVMEKTAKHLYSIFETEKLENTEINFEYLSGYDHGDALHLAVYNAFEKIFR
ncbi:alpha/beta hydrolase [Christiangramia antarctica]|uniref:Alpha/beta hydrolase n=1 Tax=Christiangramia antarctica TaxID=2058158 RepID=A0ABW5X7K4_9FLAO|nr:esterase [Gramella sp. AN32]